VLDVLKVDVEAAEWPFLRNLVDLEPTQSNYIRQLIVEAHTPYVKPRQLNKTDLAEMIYYAARLSRLGFTVVRHRQVNWCCGRFSPIMPSSLSEKCCYETFYVNTRFSQMTWLSVDLRHFSQLNNHHHYHGRAMLCKRGLWHHARPMLSCGVRLSVRLSVCLTRSYILSERINISSKFFHSRVATPF